jgi:hypothetical protein
VNDIVLVASIKNLGELTRTLQGGVSIWATFPSLNIGPEVHSIDEFDDLLSVTQDDDDGVIGIEAIR